MFPITIDFNLRVCFESISVYFNNRWSYYAHIGLNHVVYVIYERYYLIDETRAGINYKSVVLELKIFS